LGLIEENNSYGEKVRHKDYSHHHRVVMAQTIHGVKP
jgi:hypothetical protein